ncbi:MAG: hypothetical protein QMD65_01005 [Patescibacteria group bacterium]|nr:hypothetical protein [Patescibacteria group bacterium]
MCDFISWKEKAKKQLLAQKSMLLKTFSLTVPKGYKHKTQLSTLKRKNFHYFNDAVTDKNFRNATKKLIPGKTYEVKIVNIGSRLTSEECMDVYTREKAIFTGAQGLLLVCQLKKEEFPKGKRTLSFDEKKALYKDVYGDHMVPYVDCRSGGDYRFRLAYFANSCIADDCLLLFCDGE